MKFLAIISLFGGLAMTAPLADQLDARAVTSVKPSSSVKVSSSVKPMSSTGTFLQVGVGQSSSPLVVVKVTSSTLLAANVGTSGKSSSVASVKPSSMAASSVQPSLTTITPAPQSATANPTAMPSTFSAPVQGSGTLSLKNLPAMPAVIDKSFSGVLGSVYGLMSGLCNSDYKCTITVAGNIQSLLVDGNNYAGNTTVQAWCAGGHCYGSANPTVSATSPFNITCDGNNACSATISGAVDAIFTNGEQVETWGWATPAGYCTAGVCTASISAYGDPMY